MAPDLTVVVPTIGREAGCHAAIGSVELLRRETGLQIDLIVVEQGARQAYGIPDGFAGRWVFSRRTGVSHARNIGLELARAPVVFFLDDDALICVGALALRAEWMASGAPMVCGRMNGPDGMTVRGGDRRASVRGHVAWRYFAEPASLWDVEALRVVDGFDERMGPPSPLRAEEGAQLLGRLARAGYGCGVFVPVDAAIHPPFLAAPPAKARCYGQGLTGGLVMDPSPWLASYVVTSMLRRALGLVLATLRRERTGVRHRSAWLGGCFGGLIIGLSERRRPRREPFDLVSVVPAEGRV